MQIKQLNHNSNVIVKYQLLRYELYTEFQFPKVTLHAIVHEVIWVQHYIKRNEQTLTPTFLCTENFISPI